MDESGSGGDLLVTLVGIVIFLVVPIFVAHRIGRSKGRTNAWLWGFLLGWIGVVIVALLSPAPGFERRESSAAPPDVSPNERRTKTCPDCAEEILADARRCRFCDYRFETS